MKKVSLAETSSQETCFEEKIETSKAILEKLMQPDITLEESVKLYKEGIHTLKEASKQLEDAKLEFETHIGTNNTDEKPA